MAAVWRIRTQEEADILFESLARVTRAVIEPLVRRKLHASLDPEDTRSRNLDALELVSEIRVTIFEQLGKDSGIDNGIRDLNSYAATVTSNACYQYLRTKFPLRTQQRNRLRYVLTHKEDYALWKTEHGQLLCGLAKWRQSDACPRPLSATIDEFPRACAGIDDPDIYLAAVDSVLECARGPLLFDDLVEHLMRSFGITERVELQSGNDPSGLDLENTIADPAPTPEQLFESRESLQKLWEGVKTLTLNQRKSLLLNLRAGRAEGLISVLPLRGIASIREIAAILDYDPMQFGAIWNSLPWDDLRLAEELGLTRQQVINLRQSARAKLARLRI